MCVFGCISLIVKVHSINSGAVCTLGFPGVHLLPITFTCEFYFFSPPPHTLLWLLRFKEPLPLRAWWWWDGVQARQTLRFDLCLVQLTRWHATAGGACIPEGMFDGIAWFTISEWHVSGITRCYYSWNAHWECRFSLHFSVFLKFEKSHSHMFLGPWDYALYGIKFTKARK